MQITLGLICHNNNSDNNITNITTMAIITSWQWKYY